MCDIKRVTQNEIHLHVTDNAFCW